MLLHLQASTRTAKYILVYQAIKHMIQTKELQAHEKLPSKRHLAKDNGLSLNTVISAYDQLLVEGYIYSVERRGYFVAEVEFQVNLSQEPNNNLQLDHAAPSFIYDLTQASTDDTLFPYKHFKRLFSHQLDQTQSDFLSSAPVAGHQSLRQALQRYLKQSRGVPCTWDQIIIGPSTHYLLHILLDLLDRVKGIGIEDPGYHEAISLFKGRQLDIFSISLDEQGLMVDQLDEGIQVICTTPNHQFPTGIMMPLERRQALLKWASKKPSHWIIEDDYDSEFKYSGVPIPSLAHLDQQNKVIFMGSFSRILANGMRVSYMVLPRPLLQVYQQVEKRYAPSVNSLLQLTLAEFIQSGYLETHLNRARRFYKHKRDILIQALKKQDPHCQIEAAEAGLHILLTPSFVFDASAFITACQANGIKLHLLSAYSLTPHHQQDQTLFISFSSIQEAELEAISTTIYHLLKACQIKSQHLKSIK